MSPIWWIVYAIVALVVVAGVAVLWATVDRRRGRAVESEGERLEQPVEARRRWRR